jgi:hypothetical protein
LPRLWRPTWALRHVTDVCFQSYAVPVLQFPGMLRVQNGLPISRDSLTSVSQPLQTNLRFLDLRGLLRPALTPSGLAWTSASPGLPFIGFFSFRDFSLGLASLTIHLLPVSVGEAGSLFKIWRAPTDGS